MRKRTYGKLVVIGIILFVSALCPSMVLAACKAPAGFPDYMISHAAGHVKRAPVKETRRGP